MKQQRDANGRFLSNKTPATPTKKAKPSKQKVTQVANPVGKVAPTPPKKMINRIALILDASGSMSGLRAKCLEETNKQIANIKAEAANSGQDTRISIYTFSDHSTKRVVNQEYFQSTPLLTLKDYVTGGGTPLVDAVTEACKDLEALDSKTEDVSFLVVTLTDGDENTSSQYNKTMLPSRLATLQGTDRWSFAFLGPKGCEWFLQRHGVPVGNIQVWEQTEQGLDIANQAVTRGVQSYYQGRTLGVTSTKGFFTTDLSKVTTKDLQKLNDLSDRFVRWTADKEDQVSALVNKKLSSPVLAKKVGSAQYTPGCAFYELMKAEKVQARKDLCVMTRDTGKIYGGVEARKLLGLPENQDCKVKPGNHANFKVFVMSTSLNRVLPRGTEILYKKA